MTFDDRPDLPKDAKDWIVENPDAAQLLINEAHDSEAARPLAMSTWADIPQPGPQRWVIPDWLPSGGVTLLSGTGGLGKSRFALQLAAGVAGAASEWMDGATDTGLVLSGQLAGGAPVVYASWEDRPAVIARHLARLSGPSAPHVAPSMPLYLPGDTVHGVAHLGPLYTSAANRLTEHTALSRRLQDAAARVNAGLVVLDSLAAVFAASEIERAHVRGFLSPWDTWAYEHDCAVLILAHPPKSGQDYSGSTDWQAGPRALWTLTKERYGPEPRGRQSEDTRIMGWKLTCLKAKDADAGPPASVRLDWDGPALKAVGLWDSEDSEADAEAAAMGGSQNGKVRLPYAE